MSKLKETHMIRLTGILIVHDEILLIEQKVRNRKWYLPGGRLESKIMSMILFQLPMLNLCQ